MECPECQFENREGAKFCNECGHKYEVICPVCDSSNRIASKFCDECGHKLGQTPDTPSLNYIDPQAYTPKHLTDKILTSRSSIEGERKIVTVLFADVANFTTISDKIDPEEVHQIMNGCFKILMIQIHRHEGTINQFTGDGVMALFGAPISHEDHAQRACKAALEIQKAMVDYNDKIERDHKIKFKLRIGLNSGPVVVGAIGDDLRMDYTAIGDTTNLAKRMETIAEPGNIYISENTYGLVKPYFDFDDLGSIPVKGKERPQHIYKLIQSSEVQTRIEASISKGLVRFVGRKKSMPAIRTAWENAASGSGQIVGLVGEAGVGKSRLLLEFRNSIISEEFYYFEGRCIHYGGSMSYLPFSDILKSIFGSEEDKSESVIINNIKDTLISMEIEHLSAFLPAYQELLSLKNDDISWIDLEPKVKRERTFEALRSLFIRKSKERPLIIAVEDLHWIDKTSEEFISYFIDSMAHSPILLILLYRPEYTHQWGSKSYYSKIGLDQFTIESSAELISAILEGGDVAPELQSFILSRSSGNPLFMEEFTHTLLENGSIEKINNQFVLGDKINNIQVPDTIQGIISARMDRLDENLKRTMQIASVIGRDFAFRILQTITGMKEELKTYLINLQGLEFIYEKCLFPDLEYIFKHALTQEVAYNSLLVARRKEFHEKIGRAIERLYSVNLEEFYEILGYHYFQSENFESAYSYYRLSGEKAFNKFSNWEAMDAFKSALSALNNLPKSIETKKVQVEIISLLHTILRILAYPENPINLLESGIKIAEEVGDVKKLISFNSLLGKYYVFIGEPLKNREYQKRCFYEARKAENLDLMVPLADDINMSYSFTGESHKILKITKETIELIEKHKRELDYFGRNSLLYPDLLSVYGRSLAVVGEYEKGFIKLKSALDIADKADHSYTKALVNLHFGIYYVVKFEGSSAISHLKKAIEGFTECDADIYLGFTNAMLASGYLLLDDIKFAQHYIKKGVEIHSALNAPFGTPTIMLIEGNIKQKLELFEEAYEISKNALNIAKEIKDIGSEGAILISLGRTLGKIDINQHKKATNFISKGIDILRELKNKPSYSMGYICLGEIYLSLGLKTEAMVWLRKAKVIFQQMHSDYCLKMIENLIANDK